MNEDSFQHHFKTKLLKESSSFCIESLLSNKSDEDKKVDVRNSPPSSPPSTSVPPTFAPILPGFPPAGPTLPPSPHHHHLLHPPPPPLEHLLKDLVSDCALTPSITSHKDTDSDPDKLFKHMLNYLI